MNGAHPKWSIVETVAKGLKVAPTSVAKWRTRGVPARWALRLIAASGGALDVDDFLALPAIAAA